MGQDLLTALRHDGHPDLLQGGAASATREVVVGGASDTSRSRHAGDLYHRVGRARVAVYSASRYRERPWPRRSMTNSFRPFPSAFWNTAERMLCRGTDRRAWIVSAISFIVAPSGRVVRNSAIASGTPPAVDPRGIAIHLCGSRGRGGRRACAEPFDRGELAEARVITPGANDRLPRRSAVSGSRACVQRLLAARAVRALAAVAVACGGGSAGRGGLARAAACRRCSSATLAFRGCFPRLLAAVALALATSLRPVL